MSADILKTLSEIGNVAVSIYLEPDVRATEVCRSLIGGEKG